MQVSAGRAEADPGGLGARRSRQQRGAVVFLFGSFRVGAESALQRSGLETGQQALFFFERSLFPRRQGRAEGVLRYRRPLQVQAQFVQFVESGVPVSFFQKLLGCLMENDALETVVNNTVDALFAQLTGRSVRRASDFGPAALCASWREGALSLSSGRVFRSAITRRQRSELCGSCVPSRA